MLTSLDIDQYFMRTDSSGSMAFLADALGSTVGLVNSAGSIATSYSYEPFGNVTVSGTPNANSYQFSGRENDGTELYFYRARYYNSMLQRFISEDPMDFAAGDTSLFGYVNEDPTNSGDYSGLCRKDPCADTDAVSFVRSHWSDAAKIASAIEVPTENVLGIAAEESGYGTSRIALEDDNFFGIHANPKALPPFATRSDSTADGPVATFDSFYDSGRSFDAKFGGDVHGLSNPIDFTNALILAHFNTENKSFGTLLPSVIEMVRRRIHCHVRLIG